MGKSQSGMPSPQQLEEAPFLAAVELPGQVVPLTNWT
jgi:hypothetical protein